MQSKPKKSCMSIQILDNHLVSIITPSYNTSQFVLETIRSVVAQTYIYWEMIIVDDCSTDNSAEIIQNYIRQNNENRIRLFINQKNSGAAFSRNLALREAKGRWIAFLDSDDIWEPTKLELQIQFMLINGYSFSYTSYQEIDDDSILLNRKVNGPKRITKTLMHVYCWPGCLTVMYDTEIVGLVQIKNLAKNNDYAIWLKVIEKSDCYLLDQCLAKYRRRKGSISNHSKFGLLKYHYRLFNYGQEMGAVISFIQTILNVIGGIWKKLFYIKQIY